MKNNIILFNESIFLSYQYLNDLGVSYKTIEDWKQRCLGDRYYENGTAYISLNSIPKPTRKKLPSEEELRALLVGSDKNKAVEEVYKKLHYAQINHFNQYRNYYRDTFGMDAEKAFKTAMKRALWERMMQLHKEHSTGLKGTLQKGYLETLLAAYIKIYPNSYTKTSLSRSIQIAKEHGIDGAVVNLKHLGLYKPNQKFDERHAYFLRAILSIGKAYKATHILEKMKHMCEEAAIPCPSYSWVKHNAHELKKQHELHNSRYGADSTNKITPYVGIQPAMFADDQYQVDGWDLPYYYLGEDRNGNPRLKKLVLVAVKDACTRKIVGFSISRSENRLSLFEALQNAIAETGAMPFELLTDNHSYNETKEVDFFVQEARKIGMTWTVDSNPQRKAIVERGFKDIGERFCKDHYGYVGQGIKTKDKDGRSKQELIDQYQKSGKILSEAEIRAIGIEVVMNFNKTPLKANGKSPNLTLSEISQDTMDSLRQPGNYIFMHPDSDI